MLSPETGSSSCLKQTLGALMPPSHTHCSSPPSAPGDPALPYSPSAAAPPGGGGRGAPRGPAGAVVAEVCVSLQCPHLRRAGAFLMGCVRPP